MPEKKGKQIILQANKKILFFTLRRNENSQMLLSHYHKSQFLYGKTLLYSRKLIKDPLVLLSVILYVREVLSNSK